MLKNLKKKISSIMVASVVATFFMSQSVYAYKGIDISSCNWDNGRIDFNAVKNDDVEAVICKATEGVDWSDDYLDSNYWGAKNSGINHIGFYHFMSERTDPSQQARDFWDAIKDKQYDIMPCLDIETNNYDRSAFEITNRCLEFIQTFKELSGQNVMLYSGAYFSRDNLDFRIKNQPLWVAHYGVDSPMATGFPNVVGHQYSESGRVEGIRGNVDMNNFNDGMLLENANIVPNIPSVNYDNNDNGGINSVEQASEFIGNRALELQEKLNKAFNFGLAEDGIIGSASYDAIGQSQDKLGVEKDYLFGENSWSALENYLGGQSSNDGWVARLQAECNKQNFSNQIVDDMQGEITLQGCPMLKEGARGEITRLLQEKLNSLGYDTNGIDGIFENGTRRAVSQYQRDMGISADSIVYKKTWSKLLELS